MGLLSTFGAASGRAFGLTRVGAAIRDAYFNLTTLLLPGNGTNGAQNNTFLDSSSNNFTITRNGNTTQGTFSPFSQTGWGVYFDGTGDYLTAGSSISLSGSFTIEGWVYITSTAANTVLFGLGDDNTLTGLSLFVTTAGQPRMLANNAYPVSGSAGQVAANTWVHLALVRSGTSLTLYVNGSSVGTGTSSLSFSGTAYVGAENYAATIFPTAAGYSSNVRVGTTAVYTGTFTPSTTALAAITGTVLLTCQSNRFIDNSTNAYAITRNGDTSVQAFSPFAPTAAYSAATNGGSGYFDGTGDYLGIADSNNFDTNTAFTVEGWVYTGGSGAILARGGGGASWSTSNGHQFIFYVTGGVLRWQFNSSGSPVTMDSAASSVAANTWVYCVVGYNGTTTRLWLNGVSAATSTSSYTMPTTRNIVRSGQTAAGDQPFTGYISGLRFTKSDVYGVGNTSITVPTAPPTAITNTQLLLNFTNAGITDATAKNDLETVGNAQISTTQSKFGGSSMYFDGTGDWAIVPANAMFNLGTSDFTIEGWFYLTTTASAQYFLGTFAVSPNRGWFAYFDTTLKLSFTYSTTGSNAVDAGFGYTPSTNTWVHFAFVRSGADLKFYANGTQQGSTHNIGTSSIYANTQPLYIGERGSATGAAFNGYIDDLRITRYARYTANFTAPTAAFPLQ